MTSNDENPECWEILVQKCDTTTNAITPVRSRDSPATAAPSGRWESLPDVNFSVASKTSSEGYEGNSDLPYGLNNCSVASSSSFSSELSETDAAAKCSFSFQDTNVKRRARVASAKAFVPGDHIYMHCKAGVMDYQHHGILLEVRQTSNEGYILKIADFTNNSNTIALPASLNNSSLSQLSQPSDVKELNPVEIKGLRVSEFASEEWHVVQYGAPTELCKIAPPGTRTSAFCDCRRLVLARVDFLVMNPHVLPDYELLEANCECVAVWCKTGVWATTQVASVLLDAAVKKAGVAIAATGIAAALPITIPAEGLLGVAGFTTQVSLLTVAPWIPLVGVLVVGATALLLQSSNNKWRDRTIFLNQRYQEYTAAVLIQRWWRGRKRGSSCVVT